MSLPLLLAVLGCPPGSSVVTSSVAIEGPSAARLEACEPGGPRASDLTTQAPTAIGTPAVVTIIGSAALVATGIAVIIHGATGQPVANELCLSVNPDGCVYGARWRRFGEATLETFDITKSPHGTGPMIVPLGLSLSLAGLITGLGTLLFDADGDVPWLPILAGVASGALTYGLLEATDGPSSFD